MCISKNIQKPWRSVFRDMLGIDKDVIVFRKSKSLKDLVLPSKIQASKDYKLQYSTYFEKKKRNSI